MEIGLISRLDLSSRAIHLLKKMNIQTVEEFLNTPIEKLKEERGVGQKTIDELFKMRKDIAEGLIDLDSIKYSTLDGETGTNDVVELPKEMLEQISQYPITILDLPNRSLNALQRSGIHTMDQLLSITDDDFEQMSGLGKKSIQEIKECRIKWLKNISEDTSRSIDLPEKIALFYQALAGILYRIIPLDEIKLYKICNECGFSNQIENVEISEITKYDYIYLLENDSQINNCVKNYFYNFFSAQSPFIDEEEFREKIDRDFNNETFKSALFDMFKYRSNIAVIENYYVLKRDDLHEYVSNLENGVKTQILIDRLNGLTLQEIGDKNALTRERVRQITVKLISKFPLFQEDYYASIFQYFRFSKELFYNVFPKEDRWTFEYLCMRYKKGTNEINRESFNGYRGVYSYAIKNYIDKGESVKWKKGLTRQKIAWRVLIKHSGEYFSRESFAKAYNAFLEENSLDKSKYSFNEYSVNNVFRYSEHVVFNKDGDFRYYENDASTLWGLLDMRRYRDSVISSELIFRDYYEVMQEYDIRNGYELFCLLKNTVDFSPENSDIKRLIKFRRIPVMIIGEGDEEKQIIKFVKELSPIEYWTFYEAYEERYGLRKESAIANLGAYIEKYHVKGEYVTNLPYLSAKDEIKLIRKIGEKPIWSIDELERIFDEECTTSDKDALNITTMYNLGYTLNAGYAYSRKYANVTECFEKCFFSKELVDLNEISQDIVRLHMFKNYIYSIRMNLDYFDIAPKLYASISFLEREYGLNVEKIKAIQRKASCFYMEKYFNGESLWDRLKDDSDVKLLKDNKWLCTSILRQQDGVFSLPVANAVILSLERDELSLAKICMWIVDREGKMTLERLTDRLNTMFGSEIDKYKIALKIKEQGGEHNILTDSVDEYIEQIISATEGEEDLFKEEFF